MTGGAATRTAIGRVAAIVIATRAAVWTVAVASPSIWGLNRFNAAAYDLPPATQPFASHAANKVASVLARWDAIWYLVIANKTYAGPHGIPTPTGVSGWGGSVNFFPGYPLLVRLLSGRAASPSAVVIVAYVVSIVTLGLAVWFLYRLAEIEVGRRAATWAAVLFAVFPGAVFFGTPYSESLFAALSIGSLYAARTGHWRAACILAAGAAATRLPGVLLVVPLALFYVHGPTGRGPRRRVDVELAWLFLVPAALLAYFGYAWHLTGDAFAYFDIGKSFGRGLSNPVSATIAAFGSASDALGAIVHGWRRHPAEAGFRYADITGLPAFVVAVALTAIMWRRLSRPYVAFCVVSLLVILCTGPDDHPLSPAMRYTAVVFPLFIEAGRLADARPRAGAAAAAALATALLVVASLYARWIFLG